jgi:hypothetical protein
MADTDTPLRPSGFTSMTALRWFGAHADDDLKGYQSPGVWYQRGPICTGETYKSVVKLTFFKGASLEDPSGLFNSSLEGKVRRAIDFHEGDQIHEEGFVALIRAAAALNGA